MANELQLSEYKEAKIEVNAIKRLYLETRSQGLLNELDILARNITKIYWQGYIGALRHKELWNMAIRGKTGGCSLNGNMILMANGEEKKVQDLRIGDEIISPIDENRVTKAKVTDKIDKEGEIYDVLDSRGNLLYSCSEEHKIPIYKYVMPRGKDGNYKERPKELRHWEKQLKTAKELSELRTKSLNIHSNGSGKGYYNGIVTFTMPKIKRFYNVSEEEINPYLLGIWLGDGHYTKSECGITTSSIELVDEFRGMIKTIGNKKGTNSKTYRLNKDSEFVRSLEKLGLKGKGCENKFIPSICKRQDELFRRELLSGLMDTDSTISHSKIVYTSKSKQLIKDISFVVHSLGGRTRVRAFKGTCCNGSKGKIEGEYYGCSIKLPKGLLNLRKPYKKLANNKLEEKAENKDIKNTVFTVRKRGEIGRFTGISIDSPTELYVTDNYVVTHNSKSTTGTKIMYVGIMELIRQKIITKEMIKEAGGLQKYIYKRISSDQTEFLRFAMREPGNTIALIDEFSTMGETGINSTTEKAMYTEHSDLFAQEKIHKISCSPSHINDRNADIILDFVGIDEELKVSQFKLGYRDTTDWQIWYLGIVNIYVGDIMAMEFYKNYRTKKFKRLDLLKKHGIRNVKELEFSKITLATYKKMYINAQISKQTDEIILANLMTISRKSTEKIQYSIITMNFLVMQVKSMLNLVTEITKLTNKINKTEQERERERIHEAITEYNKMLKDRVNEEAEKIQIEKEYRAID